MRYKVVITYDSEYKGYVVDVPELVGCMSQGKTIDEALINIKDAIKGWLLVEDKSKRGQPLTLDIATLSPAPPVERRRQ